MQEVLQITKAPIAKIWHVLKAKAIAALEKYVSVSTFVQELRIEKNIGVQVKERFRDLDIIIPLHQ